MKRLGAYEAKTNLSRLLNEVERGASFAITKHGRTVAHLVPPASAGEISVDDAITGLRRFRDAHPLKGLSVRKLIEEGRRR